MSTKTEEVIADRPKVNLGGAAVKDALSKTQSAAMLLQLYTHTVLATPDIILNDKINTLSDSTVAQDLPAHQVTARKNANTYLSTINPLLIAKSADVIGFYNLWNSELARLKKLAADIDAPGNAASFKVGINNLVSQTKRKQADTGPTIDSLNEFLPVISADLRNITADSNYVIIALDGADGEMSRLRQRIDADNEAIRRDIGIIAGGAVAVIVGGLAIVIGLIAEIATLGLSTVIVIGGIILVAGGTAAMGLAGKNLAESQADLALRSQTLSIDEAIVTSTHMAVKTIDSLKDAISGGIEAITDLQKGWNNLQADLEQVIDQLGQADTSLGPWLIDVLNAADADWNVAYELAKGLQEYGTLAAKVVKHDQAA